MQCVRSLPNWLGSPCDAIVLAIPENWRAAPHLTEADQATNGLLSRLLESGEVSTKPWKTTVVQAPAGIATKQLVLVGTGAASDWNPLTAGRRWRRYEALGEQVARGRSVRRILWKRRSGTHRRSLVR